jgi:hypothetical protein
MMPRSIPFVQRKIHFSASFPRFCACHAAGMTAAAKAGTGARWRGLHAAAAMAPHRVVLRVFVPPKPKYGCMFSIF